MKQSQLNLIKWKLDKDGNVSRNWALRHYVSRLGAYICDLKSEGYEFLARYKKVRGGKDYEYVWMNRK